MVDTGAHATRAESLGKRHMEIDETAQEADDDPHDAAMLARARARPRQRRHSVSAPPTGAISEDAVLVMNTKSAEVRLFLQQVLKSIFIFQEVEGTNMDTLLGSFTTQERVAGTKVITQGEDGDNFYVIRSGTCDIYVKSDGDKEELVLTIGEGGYFGELALMYSCPRAATVVARTNVVLEALDQNAFNVVLRRSGRSRRAAYDSFLSKVPILHSLTGEERGKLADVLIKTNFNDGEYIIRQGATDAQTFFILYEGAAAAVSEPATLQGVERARCPEELHSLSRARSVPTPVASYAVGDYFGELALIKDAPRAVSVVAAGPCTVVSVDRSAFVRLLGPCLDTMKSHSEEYSMIDNAEGTAEGTAGEGEDEGGEAGDSPLGTRGRVSGEEGDVEAQNKRRRSLQ